MATLNPLLDSTPADLQSQAESAPYAATQFSNASFPADQGPTPQPNLMLGILRRWPWLILGLAAGLVLGLLYHMQRPPVYQSAAQLLVIKNRPEFTSTGGADTRVQVVEDYVGTQVILLRSERILEQAAKKLDDHKPFQVAPPPSQGERVGFLTSRFDVVREKEPGSNTLSNIVKLTFKAPHPADAPKYLRAIIEAYTEVLGGVYSLASTQSLNQLDNEIKAIQGRMKKDLNDLNEQENALRGKLNSDGTLDVGGVSVEDLSSIRARINNNINTQESLKLKKAEIEGDLKAIQKAGTRREARMGLMLKFGIQPDHSSSLLSPDPKDPESTLEFLKFKRTELSTRFGPGHPDMVALARQITYLEEEVKERGPRIEELDRYKNKRESELETIESQLTQLKSNLTGDENKAARMSRIQEKIDALRAGLARDDTLLRERQGERDRVVSTSNVGGFKVEDVTKPTDGAQVAPVLVQSLLLGAALGLLLGGGLGLWAELADRSFRSPADIRRRLGVPVLGHVPPIRSSDPPEIKPVTPLDPVLAVLLRPHSAEAEAVRGVRTQLLFSTSGRSHQVIQVTSPNPGDGKSTLSANLAVSLAQSGKRVVLVDCDFRKPRVHRIFALEKPDLGLASVVADQADLGAVVQGCEIENLSILPCGPRPANPAELLTTPRFQEVLDDLRTAYDFVILDTPPVLAVSDPAAVAPRADGVVLVFRMTKDARPAAERARDDLTAVGGRLLGVVVNASTEREMGYGYGHGYKYDYQYTDSYADPKT